MAGQVSSAAISPLHRDLPHRLQRPECFNPTHQAGLNGYVTPGVLEPSQEYDTPTSVEFLLAALVLSSTASVIATVFRGSY